MKQFIQGHTARRGVSLTFSDAGAGPERKQTAITEVPSIGISQNNHC